MRRALEGLAKRTLTYGLKTRADLTTKKFALSFRGPRIHGANARGKNRGALVARRAHQCVQHSRGDRRGASRSIFPSTRIEEGIANLELVPGRFERIDEGQPFLVIVDYAHTDDALRNLISTARELNPAGRIITAFWRGRRTRPHQAAADGRSRGPLSDLVVLTSDNPRSEDPLRIINDVVVGLQKVNAKYRIEPDRERGVEMALDEAQRGRHRAAGRQRARNYPVLRDRTIEFDDREMARAILRRQGFYENRPDC